MLNEWSDKEPDPPLTLAQRFGFYALIAVLGAGTIAGIYSAAVG